MNSVPPNSLSPLNGKKIEGLKYLDTEMRGSMRINPGVGPMPERIVPKDGLTLPDGRFMPEGTTLGIFLR